MNRPVMGVIGAGRVGVVLAAKLLAAGYRVSAIDARSDASRMRVSTLAPQVPVAPSDRVVESSDVVFLCVPDDSLAMVAASLVDSARPHQMFVHTSGSHGLGVLAPLEKAGARVLAFHPAMTFTGTAHDLDRTCMFGLTARESDRSFAEQLAGDLGGRAMWIDDESRTLYHAALAHGANHLITLVTQSMSMLRSIGIAEPDLVLRPLLDAALDNALSFDTAALTGPVVRGDVDTVRAHLESLQNADIDDNTRDSYRAMARATTFSAQADGRLDTERARSIRGALNEATADDLAAIVAGVR